MHTKCGFHTIPFPTVATAAYIYMKSWGIVLRMNIAPPVVNLINLQLSFTMCTFGNTHMHLVPDLVIPKSY